MKAKVCIRHQEFPFNKTMDSNTRIHKARLDELEIQDYFAKLRDLVPTVPNNKRLSKVQLLQHVIDYIMDLEVTLDFHSPTTTTNSSVLNNCSQTSERKPLAESNFCNSVVSDIFIFYFVIFNYLHLC